VKKKFVLYTAIFGQPRRFVFPEISDMSVDRFCYTDFDIPEGCGQEIPVRKGRVVQNDFYEVRKTHVDDMMAIEKNRFIKICIPDEIFDNYQYSVYVDCKRPKRIDFEAFLSEMKPGSFFMTGKHRVRNCVYYENEYITKQISHGKVHGRLFEHKGKIYFAGRHNQNRPDTYGHFWAGKTRRHLNSQ